MDQPAMFDGEALGEEIARVAAQLDAATHRLLTCIRRFDEREEWGRQGALSCAHWLSWRIGLDAATAREKVRVARALGTLPAIDDALRRGKLSYAKVRALTRVATAENERRLVDLALEATGAQLERICRTFRRVVARELLPNEHPEDARHVRHDVLPNGMVRIEAVLHPDEAAVVLKAIETARHAARVATPTPGVSAETPPRPMLAGADALVKVAESFLAHGQAAGNGGDRYQILIHLEQDPLASDATLAATLDDGTRVSAETLRRIACDASLVPIRTSATGHPLDIGRRTRTISPALRRALWSRDRGCAFPGCLHKLYVHAHHINHWAHGGKTKLDNLVLLCSAHHRMLHEGGIKVARLRGGDLEFRDRKGGVIDSAPACDEVSDDAVTSLDVEGSLPNWWGGRVDYDEAIGAMLHGA